jgi:glucose-6-phosphate-specific signal transduction histidine kinase
LTALSIAGWRQWDKFVEKYPQYSLFEQTFGRKSARVLLLIIAPLTAITLVGVTYPIWHSDGFITGLAIVAGGIILIGVYYQWDYLSEEAPKVRWFVRMLGKERARIFYWLIGSSLFIWGLFHLFGRL